MVKDLALLSALEDLQDSQISDYLNDLVKEFSDNLIAESNTDETLRLVGGLRILKRIIKDIENATADKERLRERDNKTDSKHFF